mmetsp:Transcript_54671/g.119267  ORF Transcript_54671/g.119267 Transcript_54671/m.119267 type:complete len:305 (+) Transcript_54671:352-1266(+)
MDLTTGVNVPRLFTAVASAPKSSSSFTISVDSSAPESVAKCSGVLCSEPLALGSADDCKSTPAACMCPSSTARCSGVLPATSAALASARAPKSIFTSRVSPPKAAEWSGVFFIRSRARTHAASAPISSSAIASNPISTLLWSGERPWSSTHVAGTPTARHSRTNWTEPIVAASSRVAELLSRFEAGAPNPPARSPQPWSPSSTCPDELIAPRYTSSSTTTATMSISESTPCIVGKFRLRCSSSSLVLCRRVQQHTMSSPSARAVATAAAAAAAAEAAAESGSPETAVLRALVSYHGLAEITPKA